MSQILKALSKAQKGHTSSHQANASDAEPNHSSETSVQKSSKAPLKRLDLNILFFIVLILLVAVGLFLNYTISLKVISTQGKMTSVAQSLQSQQEKFTKLNDLIAQIELTNAAQRKEIFARLDKLDSSVDAQLKESSQFFRTKFSELSKDVQEQKKNIRDLSNKYEELDDSLNSYKAQNALYDQQLYQLKKKLVDLNFDGNEPVNQ